jgi:hypothetical protein
MFHHIESRLGTKPTRKLGPHGLVRVRSLFGADFDSLASPPSSRGVGHELSLAALLEAHEPCRQSESAINFGASDSV